MEYDPKDSMLSHNTSYPTREKIRQIPQMSPFFPFLFFCGYSFLQIQTSDRQRLSMFWSPEWIFPVHPSVRLFFFFLRSEEGYGGVVVSGLERVNGWGQGTRRTYHITGQIS